MSMFQELQEKVLFEIWDVSNDPNVEFPVSPWNLGNMRPSHTSDVMARKAVDALVDRGLLDRIDDESKEFEISAKGLIYVETELELPHSVIAQYADSKDSSVFSQKAEANSWRKPDVSGDLSTATVSKVKKNLAECIRIIAESDLSQEEVAQIHGLLRICEQILELPTPKISLVKRILLWLRDIAAIKNLVDQILEYLG